MSGNSWVGKHKAELLAVAAVTAAAFTGGTSLGLLGAAGGEAAAAGAAGAGAAEAGAGAAAGGLAGADAIGAGAGTMAGGMGMGAAGGAGAAGMGDGAWLGATEDMAPGGIKGGLLNMMGADNYNRVAGGFDAFGKAGKVAQAAGLLNQQPHAQASPSLPRGNQGQVSSPMADSFMQMYGKPVMDPETLRRLRMQQQGGMYGN